MITSLYIKNYAIIDEIKMDFSNGLTTITGETGAGKSIILGALSLVLGNRIDNNGFKNQDLKCIIEAVFLNQSKQLENIFKTNELDYDEEIILRREISPNGKSRAFVNDSPVNLALLAQIAEFLIDIHSQHQNIYLRDQNFLTSLLDRYSNNENYLINYKNKFEELNRISIELEDLRNRENEIKSEFDYLSFQYKELTSFKLDELELNEIENGLKIQENAEEILNNLSEINEIIENEEFGLSLQLKEIQTLFKKIEKFHSSSNSLLERFESINIELLDIQNEIQQNIESVNNDPEKLAQLQDIYNTISLLFTKHNAKTIDELISTRESIKNKIDNIELFDEKITELDSKKAELLIELEKVALSISNNRKKHSQIFQTEIVKLIKGLGIENGNFVIHIKKADKLLNSGFDIIEFLFSSNSGLEPQNLSKIASGGEISRLMLSIKTILSEKVNLPSIVFDEIDIGVSGEIAHKMGETMERLANNMQIISITHLPQIASKGNEQFSVEKRLNLGKTITTIRKLNKEERITEIAKLLSGSEITEASIENAKILLNN